MWTQSQTTQTTHNLSLGCFHGSRDRPSLGRDESMGQVSLDELRSARLRTFAMLQDLSQQQLDHVPVPGEWSIRQVLDHLILSEQVLRGDIEILIEQAKAGKTPYLYRSFAEFNARPAFIPECALPWLEAPL